MPQPISPAGCGFMAMVFPSPRRTLARGLVAFAALLTVGVLVRPCCAAFIAAARPAAALRVAAVAPVLEDEDSSAASPKVGAAALVACSALLAAAAATAGSAAVRSKTARKYTTQTILPSLVWYPTGVKQNELDGGRLLCVCLEGIDVVLGKTSGGKVFAVADKCPPIGTSLSVGGEIVGDEIIDPQYGTAFNVFTGQPDRWCTSPPIIGGIISTIMGGPQALKVFDCKTNFFGGDVEVLIDTNMRRAYEANYWKGVLDAQGKDDGTYY